MQHRDSRTADWKGVGTIKNISNMARNFLIRGTATINGACFKPFEVVVPLENPHGSWYKLEAIQKIHPEWESVNVTSWEEV